MEAVNLILNKVWCDLTEVPVKIVQIQKPACICLGQQDKVLGLYAQKS